MAIETTDDAYTGRTDGVVVDLSVVFFAPAGARSNPRRLAALLGELTRRIDEKSFEVLLVGGDSEDESYRELAQYHEYLSFQDDTAATCDAERLNSAVRNARGELVALVDGRAFLRPGAFVQLLAAVEHDAQIACIAPTNHDVCPEDEDFDRWVRLLRRLPGTPAAIWRKDLFLCLGGFDASLSHALLADFLLRAAESAPVRLLDRALGTLPALHDEPPVQQARLDEEQRVVQAALDRFLSTEFAAFPESRLTPIFLRRTQRVVTMLEKLQTDECPTPETLLQATVVYSILAMRLDDVPNARQILDTVCTLMPEQRDIVWIYKLLILRFPMEDAPSKDDIARMEQPPSGPKVVVATPLFNQGHYLREAVLSVINQTYPNWEMVIVDDGSTDDSHEQARSILAELDDPRLTLISQENSGLGATRNRAIERSDGSFVVCLDSDDMIAPDYFAIALDMLHKNPNAGWVNAKTLVFGGSNHLAWKDDFDFVQCLIACASPCSSMIRREALEEVGLFREDLTAREDWETWLALLDQGWTFVATKDPVFLYRHAVKRPGTKAISNIPSKEEIISLHPWWFRVDLEEQTRLKAYLEYTTGRFSPWFLNTANIGRVLPVLGDREAFLEVMARIRSEYQPITKPKRWQNAPDDCYITTRKKKYGIL